MWTHRRIYGSAMIPMIHQVTVNVIESFECPSYDLSVHCLFHMLGNLADFCRIPSLCVKLNCSIWSWNAKCWFVLQIKSTTMQPESLTLETMNWLFSISFHANTVLDVDAFERLLGPCMEIMKRSIGDYETQLIKIFGSKNNITDIR